MKINKPAIINKFLIIIDWLKKESTLFLVTQSYDFHLLIAQFCRPTMFRTDAEPLWLDKHLTSMGLDLKVRLGP